MSTKKILGITGFGLFLIIGAIVFMLLSGTLRRESAAIELPDTPHIMERPGGSAADALTRIEVNRETVQDVISTIERPEIYTRNIIIESFWDGGQAAFNINVSVRGDLTSIRIYSPIELYRRIIVTPTELFIWHEGDEVPYVGTPNSAGYGGHRAADEWQKLLTFENILDLDRNDIIDAGLTELDGIVCIYALYYSPLLSNSRKYYVSIEDGLVIAVDVHDSDNMLIYTMRAGETQIGETARNAFVLPDGSVVR